MATVVRLQERTYPTLSSAIGGALGSLRMHFAAYRAGVRERRRIARELSYYSDAELGELGFSRADIPAVAAGTFRR